MLNDFMVSAQFAIFRMPEYFKFKKIISLNPFCPLSIRTQNYEVKIADCPEELAQVLKLRFEIFFREFSEKKINLSFFPYDIDGYDFQCDHLITKDLSNGRVVAAYRLLHSKVKKNRFYSEGEFNLEHIKSLRGDMLELGRACVHKDYRTGTVIGLLWKGLLEYARRTNCNYMFGCTSIPKKEFGKYARIMQQLSDKNALMEEGVAEPTKKYHLRKQPHLLKSLKESQLTEDGMSSLMHMYAMAGAKFGRTPAYDDEMECLDLFTLINLQELPTSFKRKFSC